MRVWTIANQKGGVGKTTSAVTLGGLLAQQGRRVLLLDLDPHGSLSSYFRFNPDEQQQSTYSLFQERKNLSREFVNSMIQPSGFDNLSVIPASTALATLERQAIGQDGLGLVIAKALSLVKDEYDHVLIDSPPLLGVLLINALAACRYLIIPVQTEFLALKGLERMVHTMEMMKKSRKHGLDYVVVPTMFDQRTQASVGALRTLRMDYEQCIWPGKIPVDTRFRDASKAGVPMSVFAKDSRGTAAYHSLLKWLAQHEVAQREKQAAAK
ncbi:MAG: ParA family protein [Cellvibrionaceae bacterium]